MASPQDNPIYTAAEDQATQPVDVHVIRHGSTQMNSDTSTDRMRGWGDVPLDEEGKKESKKVAQQMKGQEVPFIFHSDLSRAADTAADVADTTGGQMVSMPELRTWHIGQLEGTKSDDANPLLALYATRYPDVPLPGGESFNEFKGRVLHGVGLANQMAGGQPYAIVTHHKVERLLNAWNAAGQPANGDVDKREFLAEGQDPGTIQKLPIGIGPVIGEGVKSKQGQKVKPQTKPDTAQIAKDVAYDLFVPDSLKPVADEKWEDYHKRMSDYVKKNYVGKMDLPDVGQDPNAQLTKGIVEGLGMFAPPGPEAGAASKALFLGLGGMKRLLGEKAFTKATDTAAQLSEKYSKNVAAGISPESLERLISLKTGVTFGADDLARYEISDKNLQFKKDWPRWSDNPEDPNYTGWHFKQGQLVEPKYESPVPLDKVIDAPDLFKAYPDLKKVLFSDVNLWAGPDIKGHAGWEKSGEYRIAIGNGPDEEKKSILLHELQHFIQDLEKMAQGGNVRMFEPPRLNEAEGMLSKEEEIFTNKLGERGINYQTVKNAKQFPYTAQLHGDTSWDPVTGHTVTRSPEEVQAMMKKITPEDEKWFKYFEDAHNNLKFINYKVFENYQSLAGETEARNVQKRMDMTDEERRKTLPQETEDVPREKQKVLK